MTAAPAHVVVDASVVIAVIDGDDLHHDVCMAALRSRTASNWAIPTTVLAESLVRAASSGPATLSAVRARVATAFGPSRVIDEDVALAAARLRAVHRSLRLPDALVLAVAEVDEADEVLTCDRRWAPVSGRVTVVARDAE